MKLRTDYVSNSSSSSFVLIGDAFERKDFEESSFFNGGSEDTDSDYEDSDYDDWFSKCYDLGLTVERGINDFYDQYVVGLTYYNMKDDETKATFHKRIEELLRKAFPQKKDFKVGLKTDAGYDG